MITSLSGIPAPAYDGRTAEARGGYAVPEYTFDLSPKLLAKAPGPIWALWAMASQDNAPSDLHRDLVRVGYRSYLAEWIFDLTADSADEVMYHLPTGADRPREMPFHSAQLAKQRGHTKVLGSLTWLLQETAQRMGRLPWVYIGCMSDWFWTNPWAAWAFEDSVWDSVKVFTDSQGRPLCNIAQDVAGVKDVRSLEWQGHLLLRKWGFGNGYEPRPLVGTSWGNYAEYTGFTTDQLLRVTGEEGTGHGGHWAVPFREIQGPQCVLDITGSSEDYLAGHMAAGRGVTFPAWRWIDGQRPPEAERVKERALALIAAGAEPQPA